ncbi:MAG: cob(I)yrinic acid a,c-diamide adenosyltransferase [Pseudomonadota bacterium]
MSLYPEVRESNSKSPGLGLIHVYFGQGVGKTTRVVGLAVRAAGAGLKVAFVQFMKTGDSGEVAIFKKIDNIDYFSPGRHPFVREAGPERVHFDHAAKALERAWEAVGQGVDVLICDEILNAVFFKILSPENILDLIQACRGRVELVLTGADARDEIIEAADYVTQFVQIKHPYYAGVSARRGLEF